MLIDVRLHSLVHNSNERLDKSVHLSELLSRLVATRKVQVRTAITKNSARIGQNGRIVRVVVGKQSLLRGRFGVIVDGGTTAALEHIYRRVRHDDVLDESVEALEQNGLLDLLARRQVPQDSCDALLDGLVRCAFQQAYERRYATGVSNLDLVLVIGAAVREISQSTARVAMHIGHVAIEHVTQLAYAAQQTSLLLDRVVLVAQVLQVGRRVRLDLVGRVR